MPHIAAAALSMVGWGCPAVNFFWERERAEGGGASLLTRKRGSQLLAKRSDRGLPRQPCADSAKSFRGRPYRASLWSSSSGASDWTLFPGDPAAP